VWINKEREFHYRSSFGAGFKSRINNLSLILHCKSHWPLARISKWSHLLLWPVEVAWSATAEAWPTWVRALKYSVFLSILWQYYDQIDGVPVGSSLGPVLANIFMCHFEESWLANNQSRPSIWFRYVDDTFSLFDSKDTASRFLDFLNSRHPNIKFTMALEENQEIPFLDVCIKRDHNTFSATVHHKKTFTGLYTKWDSFTPRKYKINLIRTLTYRCLRIYSKSTSLQSTLSDLKNYLLQNGNPRGLINYNVNDVLNKHKDRPSEPTLTVPKKDVIFVLPYLGFR